MGAKQKVVRGAATKHSNWLILLSIFDNVVKTECLLCSPLGPTAPPLSRLPRDNTHAQKRGLKNRFLDECVSLSSMIHRRHSLPFSRSVIALYDRTYVVSVDLW